MSQPLLLNSAPGDRLEDLTEQVVLLQAEVKQLRRDLDQSAKINLKTIGRLLSPLYSALKPIFGEIAEAEEVVGPAANPKWESWKARMPGRPAEFIDLLLLHQSMSVKQFMAAAHCGKDAVYQTVSKLGQAGLVTNSGGRYSLKDS